MAGCLVENKRPNIKASKHLYYLFKTYYLIFFFVGIVRIYIVAANTPAAKTIFIQVSCIKKYEETVMPIHALPIPIIFALTEIPLPSIKSLTKRPKIL